MRVSSLLCLARLWSNLFSTNEYKGFLLQGKCSRTVKLTNRTRLVLTWNFSLHLRNVYVSTASHLGLVGNLYMMCFSFHCWLYAALLYTRQSGKQKGRAIAQAVSSWFPIAADWVWSQVKSGGICGVRSCIGAGFLWVFRFPLSILVLPTAPHSSSIIRGWYSTSISGRRTKWTQSHPIINNLKTIETEHLKEMT
jgi:hypothetical protein